MGVVLCGSDEKPIAHGIVTRVLRVLAGRSDELGQAFRIEFSNRNGALSSSEELI
jgi:hypothetical protein